MEKKQIIIKNKSSKISWELFINMFKKAATKYADNYELTDEIKKIVSDVWSWLNGSDQRRAFYIAGRTGTGKTTLCNILFDTFKALNIFYTYDNRFYALSPIGRKEIEINTEYMKTGQFELLSRGSIFIDDFGMNKKVMYMGNEMFPMEDILMHRLDDLKYTYTFFSSNYPIDHNIIKEKYGERIADRLKYNCMYFVLNGKNFRNG